MLTHTTCTLSISGLPGKEGLPGLNGTDGPHGAVGLPGLPGMKGDQGRVKSGNFGHQVNWDIHLQIAVSSGFSLFVGLIYFLLQ